MTLLTFSILACLSFSNAELDFTGHQVLRTVPQTAAQADILAGLVDTFDIWTGVGVRREVDIRASPESYDELVSILESHNIPHSLMIQDVQQLIELSKPVPTGQRDAAGHSMDWTSYHSVEDMYSYLDYLETNFDFVTTESIGKSYEGVEMMLAKVCRGGCGNKPAMWIDGNIHAREWITSAVVTFMLRELVENDSAHPDLLDSLDWYILPMVNPDGYNHTRTENRLWRKTRSPNGNNCFGTDANRNFGYQWGTGGSSDNPCSDTYMGSEAFSEIETKNIRQWLTMHKDTVKFYNNIHSYSQLILLPWGFSYDEPANIDDLYRVAEAGNDALYAAHQKTYEVGCIPCMLYVASGGSLDWTLGQLGIPYSYGMELRDTGEYGFLLPPEQIIPTGEEAWAFHLTVARELIKEFVP